MWYIRAMEKNNYLRLLPFPGVFVFIFFLFLGMVPASQAAIYKYTDKNGVTHFTDRYESVPREYRNQIQTIRDTATPEPAEKPAADLEKKEERKTKPGEVAAPDPAKKEAEEKAKQEKADQEKKQKEFDEKAKRIGDLQKEIADREKELQGLRTTWMVYDRQTVFRLNQEIADLRKEIEDIQKEMAEMK
jgi:Skp family chaperone for outer membrane proteins